MSTPVAVDWAETAEDLEGRCRAEREVERRKRLGVRPRMPRPVAKRPTRRGGRRGARGDDGRARRVGPGRRRLRWSRRPHREAPGRPAERARPPAPVEPGAQPRRAHRRGDPPARRGRTYATIADKRASADAYLAELAADPVRVKQLCGWDWLTAAPNALSAA